MKTNVMFENVKYIVKEEDKAVVCLMDASMQLSKLNSWINISRDMWKKKFPDVDFEGDFKVKSVATCKEGDEFDVTLGKRLAESKAKKHAFKIAAQVYDLIWEYMTKGVEENANLAYNCSKAAELEEAHINHLINN